MMLRTKIEISCNGKNEKTMNASFIGLINDEECRAVINLDDAVKMLAETKPIEVKNIKYSHITQNKRFVVLVENKDGEKYVFISPKINSMVTMVDNNPSFLCRDGKKYKFL